MKTALTVLLLVVAAIAVTYFVPGQASPSAFVPTVLDSSSYPGTAMDMAAKINDLSPTPPTEQTWTVREIEFVKNEPYAYVVYHDTHNIFRILVETGQSSAYRTVATFEADRAGWKLVGGEDLAKDKETVKISPN